MTLSWRLCNEVWYRMIYFTNNITVVWTWIKNFNHARFYAAITHPWPNLKFVFLLSLWVSGGSIWSVHPSFPALSIAIAGASEIYPWDMRKTSRWRHNDHAGVSNHQPHGCLHNRLFRRRSKETSKFRVTGLCAGNSPGPVNSPHKGPVTRKMFPFDDVIMIVPCHAITTVSNTKRMHNSCNVLWFTKCPVNNSIT